jgi:sirohydrochlorin cobaltochelatase
MTQQAIILFAHGARSPVWAEPFERLRALVQARQPEAQVALAFLELMTPSLADQVAACVGQGVSTVTVVPIFLGQGGHIRRDLPLLIDSLRQTYPQLDLHVATAVGEDEQVLHAIANYCVDVASVNKE